MVAPAAAWDNAYPSVAQGELTQFPASVPAVATVRVTVTAPAGCARSVAPNTPRPMLPAVAAVAMKRRRRRRFPFPEMDTLPRLRSVRLLMTTPQSLGGPNVFPGCERSKRFQPRLMCCALPKDGKSVV